MPNPTRPALDPVVRDRIKFECPTCSATHERGFVNGVDTFRCLRCGYRGFGHHPDADIDAEVQAEHLSANVFNRAHGIATVPQGVDQLWGCDV